MRVCRRRVWRLWTISRAQTYAHGPLAFLNTLDRLPNRKRRKPRPRYEGQEGDANRSRRWKRRLTAAAAVSGANLRAALDCAVLEYARRAEEIDRAAAQSRNGASLAPFEIERRAAVSRARQADERDFESGPLPRKTRGAAPCVCVCVLSHTTQGAALRELSRVPRRGRMGRSVLTVSRFDQERARVVRSSLGVERRPRISRARHATRLGASRRNKPFFGEGRARRRVERPPRMIRRRDARLGSLFLKTRRYETRVYGCSFFQITPVETRTRWARDFRFSSQARVQEGAFS